MEQTNQFEPKVSIIIPVYNTELYVREAIESICNQTLRELEIIVINDGSTDGSPRVIEEMAVADNRIRVYHQKNQGQGAARNFGVSQANAPYIYFMDSDDVLEADALEVCYNTCKELECEFVFFDATILNPESKHIMGMTYDRSHCLTEGKVQSGEAFLRQMLEGYCYSPSPCLLLISKYMFDRYGLYFSEGFIHEDQHFTGTVFFEASRTTYINRKFFKRRYREASVMTQKFSWRNIEGYLRVKKLLEDEIDEPHLETLDLLLSQMLTAMTWNAHVLPFKDRIRLYKILRKPEFAKYVPYKTTLKMLLKSFLKPGR